MQIVDLDQVLEIGKITRETSETFHRYLSMEGYFNLEIPRSGELNDEVYDPSSRIETILRSSFPDQEVICEEIVGNSSSDVLYDERVYAVCDGRVVASVTLFSRVHYSHPQDPPLLRSPLEFYAEFALDEFAEQTKQALKKMDGYIKGFHYGVPQGVTIQPGNFGLASIVLWEDGKAHSSSGYALKEARVPIQARLVTPYGI